MVKRLYAVLGFLWAVAAQAQLSGGGLVAASAGQSSYTHFANPSGAELSFLTNAGDANIATYFADSAINLDAIAFQVGFKACQSTSTPPNSAAWQACLVGSTGAGTGLAEVQSLGKKATILLEGWTTNTYPTWTGAPTIGGTSSVSALGIPWATTNDNYNSNWRSFQGYLATELASYSGTVNRLSVAVPAAEVTLIGCQSTTFPTPSTSGAFTGSGGAAYSSSGYTSSIQSDISNANSLFSLPLLLDAPQPDGSLNPIICLSVTGDTTLYSTSTLGYAQGLNGGSPSVTPTLFAADLAAPKKNTPYGSARAYSTMGLSNGTTSITPSTQPSAFQFTGNYTGTGNFHSGNPLAAVCWALAWPQTNHLELYPVDHTAYEAGKCAICGLAELAVHNPGKYCPSI